MSRVALALLALLPLTACGDDGGDGAANAPQGSATSAPTTSGPQPAPPPSISGPVNRHEVVRLTGNQLPMELNDFYFEPTFVQAAPGATVTVRLRNQGNVQHTFTLDQQGVDRVLQPGQEAEVQVQLPPGGGPAVFVCRFHRAQGMQGAFYFP